MKPNVFIDFESRSCVDLPACGSVVYASHWTTEPLSMAWVHEDNDETHLWKLGETFPAELFVECTPWSWNASFDQALIDHCAYFDGIRKPSWERVHCAMSFAAQLGAPGKLEKAMSFMAEIEHTKDMGGHAIMMRLCRGTYEAL